MNGGERDKTEEEERVLIVGISVIAKARFYDDHKGRRITIFQPPWALEHKG